MQTRFSQIFKSAELQHTIEEQGYAIVDFIDKEGIEGLRKESEAMLQNMIAQGFDQVKTFHSAGRSEDTNVRNTSTQIIRKYYQPGIAQYFIDSEIDFISGVHQIKPPGSKSKLNPHQDSSHVDEEQFLAVYIWCPLEDTTMQNGTLHILPGSHKLGNKQRSLNVPWEFNKIPYYLVMYRFMKPLMVKAGQAVIFHSAMIHSSPPNQTANYRLAVNGLVKPKASPYCHYFTDGQTPAGMVDVFDITPEFFYTEEITKRPSAKYKLLRHEPLQKANLNLINFYRYFAKQRN